jgi:DNA-directed RNA polymerase subunit M/transcription elongation factor TFIIS
MQFCDSCGSTMVKVEDEWICRECDPESINAATETEDGQTPSPRSAKLTNLPTTSSGAVREEDAMRWLDSLDKPSAREF